MPLPSSPRVALLGFSIECNKFAPPATKAHFLARTYLEGEDIVLEARGPAPTMLGETPGFVAAMDAAGPWNPVGVVLAMSEPNGPVEHSFFSELLETMTRRLTAALTTEEDDPDGVLFAAVRAIVGPAVPIAATLIFTPTSRRAWCARSTLLSVTAPTRISTCASAAPRRRRRSARCSPAREPSGPSSGCRSCRRR